MKYKLIQDSPVTLTFFIGRLMNYPLDDIKNLNNRWIVRDMQGGLLIYLGDTLDRESIVSQCMDIHRNPRISKWISIKAWIIED